MRFGKEISSQYIYFGLFIFNLTGRDCLTLNTKARRFFKTSRTTDRMSQKAWFLISPSPGHNRSINPTVGPVSLFPVDTSPCPLSPITVAQRYPHRQYSVSALETGESRDLSLPTRYKADFRPYGEFTQRRSVVSYRRFGTIYAPLFKVQAAGSAWSMKMASIRFPATTVTNVCWVKSQKNEDVVW